jgi:hypothetical protein
MQISYLALGSQGWMSIVTDIFAGTAAIVFAWGLWRVSGYWLGPLLIAAYGLGLLAKAVFLPDPAEGYPIGTPNGPAHLVTWHGQLHNSVSVALAVGGLILALLSMAWYFWFSRKERLWAIYSLLTLGLILASGRLVPQADMGLAQRIIFGWLELWLLALALHALRMAPANLAHHQGQR